jgi:hypothetical protein
MAALSMTADIPFLRAIRGLTTPDGAGCPVTIHSPHPPIPSGEWRGFGGDIFQSPDLRSGPEIPDGWNVAVLFVTALAARIFVATFPGYLQTVSSPDIWTRKLPRAFKAAISILRVSWEYPTPMRQRDRIRAGRYRGRMSDGTVAGRVRE